MTNSHSDPNRDLAVYLAETSKRKLIESRRYYLTGILIFFAAMLTFGWLILQQQKPAGWPTVQGVVAECSLTSEWGYKTTQFGVKIHFTYTVDGKSTWATTIRPENNRFDSRSAAEAFIASHTIGLPVTVHYNPTFPAEAYLETGHNPVFWYLIILGSFGLLFCLLKYLRTHRQQSQSFQQP